MGTDRNKHLCSSSSVHPDLTASSKIPAAFVPIAATASIKTFSFHQTNLGAVDIFETRWIRKMESLAGLIFPMDLVSQLYLASVSSASCQHDTPLGTQCLGCRGASCGLSAVFSAGGFCLWNKLSHKQVRDDGKSSQLKVIWLCWLCS